MAGGDAMETSKDDSAEKKTRTEGAGSSTHQQPGRARGGLDLNFPLPNEKGPACLVKVGNSEQLLSSALCVAISRDQSEVGSIDCEIQPKKGMHFFCVLLF